MPISEPSRNHFTMVQTLCLALASRSPRARFAGGTARSRGAFVVALRLCLAGSVRHSTRGHPCGPFSFCLSCVLVCRAARFRLAFRANALSRSSSPVALSQVLRLRCSGSGAQVAQVVSFSLSSRSLKRRFLLRSRRVTLLAWRFCARVFESLSRDCPFAADARGQRPKALIHR
jgi:hypothetical protein